MSFLDAVFLSIFIGGFVLTLIAVVVGELFEFGEGVAEGVGDAVSDTLGGIGETDVDIGATDLAGDLGTETQGIFSSRVLFAGLTTFGGCGFIGSVLDWSTIASVALGLVGFVGGSLAMWAFLWSVVSQSGSMRVRRANYVGVTAHVVTTIPAHSLGQVSFTVPGSGAGQTEAALSLNGREIPVGTSVEIVRVNPSNVVVEKTQRR